MIDSIKIKPLFNTEIKDKTYIKYEIQAKELVSVDKIIKDKHQTSIQVKSIW